MNNYILVDRVPVIENDTPRWVDFWKQDWLRRVAITRLDVGVVSTVFLGLDHAFGTSDVPILFETMVFYNDGSDHTYRYATWDEALEGHHLVTDILYQNGGRLTLKKR